MKTRFVFLTGLAALFFQSHVFAGELRIGGLSWQDQLKDRPVFRTSLSNETLLIVLDQEGGKSLSVWPVSPAIFKQKAKWKKL
ncbi:MAG: hypothetical protein JNM63_02855, partial [Spirochaetia bacterium]|nr:hypothetical protein [Spirochaetia bacterium]